MTIHAAEMVCSLGRDINTACAAARAGLTRLDGVACRIKGDYLDDETAVGHSVTGLTNGFEGDARLIRLLSEAARNLFQHPAASTAIQGRIGWFVSLPSAARTRSGLDALEENSRSTYEEILPEPSGVTDAVRGKHIISAALAFTGLSIPMDSVQVSTAGQVGFAELVLAAERKLEEGAIDAAVVGGVDALVSDPEVRWLAATGRLKTDEQASGLQPGEAAAVMLVTKSGNVAGQVIPPVANIRHVQLAQSQRSYASGAAPDGNGLVEALRPLASTQCGDGQSPWLVMDQNGEYFRAADWGQAFVTLFASIPDYEDATVWYPANSFGDTGCASGAVATCMVLRAYARTYAPSNLAAVVCSSDGPDRAAVLVEKQ